MAKNSSGQQFLVGKLPAAVIWATEEKSYGGRSGKRLI
jgi:hypothetical protein